MIKNLIIVKVKQMYSKCENNLSMINISSLLINCILLDCPSFCKICDEYGTCIQCIGVHRILNRDINSCDCEIGYYNDPLKSDC